MPKATDSTSLSQIMPGIYPPGTPSLPQELLAQMCNNASFFYATPESPSHNADSWWQGFAYGSMHQVSNPQPLTHGRL